MIIKFVCPFRYIIYSNSGGGKSTLASELIENRRNCMENAPEKVLYFAKFHTSVPKNIINDVEFRSGLPNEEDLEKDYKAGVLFILDDLQHILFDSPIIALLFQQSRHKNISIIVLSQNLFPKGKIQRDISLNCNGIFLLRTCRDLSSVKTLSFQLSPIKPYKLSEIYLRFANEPYKYIFINLGVDTPDLLRYTSNLFSQDNTCKVFLDDDQLEKLQRYETKSEFGDEIQIFELSF